MVNSISASFVAGCEAVVAAVGAGAWPGDPETMSAQIHGEIPKRSIPLPIHAFLSAFFMVKRLRRN
jgi:hypothetical protein